ncbi:hypothetical protein N8Z92_04550 [Schleiferiaceae bacterium]|nr:hypothetical protein [Schleiferiaceae bacterium]
MRLVVIPSGKYPSNRASSINSTNHANAFSKLCDVTIFCDNTDFEIVSRPSNVNQIVLPKGYKKYLSVWSCYGTFEMVYSRHLVFSVIFSLFNRCSIIHELHAKPSDFGFFSNILFKILKFRNHVKFVSITRSLELDLGLNKLKDRSIVLNDVSNWSKRPFNIYARKIVYFGSVDESKNWRKIVYLARALSTHQFQLYALTKPQIADIPPNLEVIVATPYDDLEELIYQEARVVLIPNINTQNLRGVDIGRYTSPLKLFDSLALSKIIICNSIDVLADYKGLPNVICAKSDNIDDWVCAINESFHNPVILPNKQLNFPLSYTERSKILWSYFHA